MSTAQQPTVPVLLTDGGDTPSRSWYDIPYEETPATGLGITPLYVLDEESEFGGSVEVSDKYCLTHLRTGLTLPVLYDAERERPVLLEVAARLVAAGFDDWSQWASGADVPTDARLAYEEARRAAYLNAAEAE